MKKIFILSIIALCIALVPSLAQAYSQSFTSDGTWTVPTGVTSFRVEVWGAGGGGGGSDSGHGDGSGGGGGGYTAKTFSNISGGDTYVIKIGRGGAGVVSKNGNDGGTSYFKKSSNNDSLDTSSDLYATGGRGGVYGSSGIRQGGLGGSGYNGDVNYTGHSGEDFSKFPMGDGGVPGDINNNSSLCSSSSIYRNISVCMEGYQDNNPGDNFGNRSGADFIPVGSSGVSGDSAGSAGYLGNGGSTGRSNNISGSGGNGKVLITYVVPTVTTPVIAMNSYYPIDYRHDYNDRYRYRPTPIVPLEVSCYSSPTSINTGDGVTWRANTSGGNGYYSITWSGNEGLSGYGTSVYKNYYNSGSKYASVTVVSDGQTITRNCNNNVDVTERYNYYNYNNNYNYNYNNLYVSCSANTTYAPVETNVVWRAYASGGNGYYTYSWSGTDYIGESGEILNTAYHSTGIKSANVTVYSGGQTATQSCTNSVNITTPIVQYNQYYPSYNYNQSNIQIACYPDKIGAKVGSPVTWAVEATGGTGNFTYSWTGSENLSGNMSSLVKVYDTKGTKTATVTVVSSTGQSATQICGKSVSVSDYYQGNGNTVVKSKPATTVVNNNQDDNSLSAASLFSLKNVPWGWVAVLIILVLFGTVLYLIFNRNKI
jgi:hypothetical protein